MSHFVLTGLVLLAGFWARAEIDLSDVLARNARLMKTIETEGYATPQARSEIRQAFEQFKARVENEKVTDAGRLAAIQAYKASMTKFQKATAAQAAWYQSSRGDTTMSRVKQLDKIEQAAKAQGVVSAKVVSKEPIQKDADKPVNNKPAEKPVRLVGNDDKDDGYENLPQPPKGSFGQPTGSGEVTKADEKPAAVTEEKTGRDPAQAEKDAKWKSNMENLTARCFYAGYQGHDVNGKCKPASDDPASQNKQSGEFGTAETNLKCGKTLLACNPVLFGLGSNGRAICVPRATNATASCEKNSKLKKKCGEEEAAKQSENARCAAIAKAHEEYLKVLSASAGKNDSMTAFMELRRSLAISCGKRQVERAKELTITKAKRTNDADFDKTCDQLQPRFTFLGELLSLEKSVGRDTRDSGATSTPGRN